MILQWSNHIRPFLLGFIEFYWFLLGFFKSPSTFFGFTRHYRVLLSFIGSYCFFTGFHWVPVSIQTFLKVGLLYFTGYYWILLGFTRLNAVAAPFIFLSTRFYQFFNSFTQVRYMLHLI